MTWEKLYFTTPAQLMRKDTRSRRWFRRDTTAGHHGSLSRGDGTARRQSVTDNDRKQREDKYGVGHHGNKLFCRAVTSISGYGTK